MNFFSLFKRSFLYKIKKKINIDIDKSINTNHSLEDLFVRYGTDKAHYWNEGENNLGHGYTKFYEENISSFRDKKINVLEIGSFSGASAAAFSKYFFNAYIYCADINISNFKYYSKYIRVLGVDINNPDHLKKFYKKININANQEFFDIIIDDGSHKLSDMYKSINNLYKNVKKGGYFIIEDCLFPNLYDHLNDVQELKINQLIKKINNNETFQSNLLTKEFIQDIKNSIESIKMYNGNLNDSNIVFFKKK